MTPTFPILEHRQNPLRNLGGRSRLPAGMDHYRRKEDVDWFLKQLHLPQIATRPVLLDPPVLRENKHWKFIAPLIAIAGLGLATIALMRNNPTSTKMSVLIPGDRAVYRWVGYHRQMFPMPQP